IEMFKWLIIPIILGATIGGCSGHYVVSEYDNYRQNVVRDQILQHGGGGCTPNFSTGGCL
ncbi:MAG: hypothetical protein KJO69_11190, partial [Gammaproteobacteria bacterium]|nr:hypothetical protein [Gammaproteobacteria bacterium]